MAYNYDLIVVGAGASGCFAAIHAANSGLKVLILEKSNKSLSKVKISGGGRCNVTHDCLEVTELVKHYPRGGKKLTSAFKQFSVQDTINWFQSRGVELKIEDDGRMFPISNNSQSIIDCLENEMTKGGVSLTLGQEVQSFIKLDNGFKIITRDKEYESHKLLVSMGGHPKLKSYIYLTKHNIKIEKPYPSLFTFNIPQSPFKDLLGLSVPNAEVRIQGMKLKNNGPLLITHWGLSAPCIIILSALAAKELFEINYRFKILLNWTGILEKDLRAQLEEQLDSKSQTQISNFRLDGIPKRLWAKILELSGIKANELCNDIKGKKFNKLISCLCQFELQVEGKTTYKEEFVNAGGVQLSEIDLNTFQSKSIPDLYFSGEVLDVDGLTGGFNFQFAWTSGYLSAKSILDS